MQFLIKNSFFFITFLFFVLKGNTQNPPNWTDKELMQPSQLANIITNKKENVFIISVGPFSTIPATVHTGMAGEKEGIDKLKKQLSALKKDQEIIIYCGCCPFEHCPNIRPAIDVLKEMKFTNFYLLNLPDNIKKDWIDKGYPVVKN